MPAFLGKALNIIMLYYLKDKLKLDIGQKILKEHCLNSQPFLPSQSRVEYDSEESQESGEDDEDIDGGVFASTSQNQEHSNSNSYR